MKIGIMTFHASLNCGSMLQAYALQEILKNKYGQDVELINYSNKGQRNYYSLWDTRFRPRVQMKNIKSLPFWNLIKSVRKDYKFFSDKYFQLSGDLIKDYQGLVGLDRKYDMVIAGGDQVWNIKCRDADDAYFLSFVDSAIKVSYSPSLGAKDINKFANDPSKYANYLNNFKYLSVREPNGQKWIKNLIGKEIPIIADPTLLLTAEEWVEKLDIECIDEKFIFYYAFSFEKKENNEALMKISEKTGMPVYVIDGKSWGIYKLYNYNIQMFRFSGPRAFVTLIKNAELVLTQSFHGTLFSALFHKKFWSFRSQVIVHTDDDRATAILAQLGLSDRYVVLSELLDKDIMEDIDYSNVDSKIEDLRNNAFVYIEQFLENNCN